ncbi:protein-S-isoprenylcysteine methyltransferase [Lysobacteraceae bacterium NML07-0707]|nr:protein-S-isoprenylcysteine methyltransferase [Xanthomonadaceae bacterium NML07-0707]
MRALELKIPPPVVMAILAAAMYAAVRLLPHWQLSLPIFMRAGLAGLWGIAGITTAVLGMMAFRRHRTTLNPLRPDSSSQIVTTGIFAHSRNPMYLGMVFCLTGWALWLAHPLALSGVVLFIACLHWLQIKPEERILLHKFGEPYAQYLRRVRRWC